MAGQAGFEPATLGFGVRCSGQLELLTLPFAEDSKRVSASLWLNLIGADALAASGQSRALIHRRRG